ncbi:transforming growth factor beta activator LRRC33 [Lampris incognitus]|uniref:transforming growth factor beta activator LRRC33 n=1 Tax=Lampris incognitus TaxID=2546036 RepID=UPI0024B484DD|nr:transforming growth factor beta activator LRRC33 [Lampris incognitus]
MPVHTLFPAFVRLFAAWTVMIPVSSHPQHNQCRLILKTGLCNNAKLSSVPLGLPSNIEELQLNHNHIQTLLDNSFTQYPSIISVGLAGNHMEKLEQNTFQDSQQIENLNLAENCLHIGYQETSHALSKLPVLRVLDLSENQLEDDMASVLLQNLTSLEYLNLSRNLLLRLDESSFSSLHKLRELDLQRNRLFEIDKAFEGTPKLERLNLAFNYLPCLIDFHMTQLVVLNVSHNSIEWFVARQDLLDTFHLETLDLTDNNLLFFPFLPSKSRLQNLYLSHNSISFYEHLAEDPTLQNWTISVQFFNLNSNVSNVTVSLWDESLHGDISSLEILDLRGNQVGYFPKGFVRKMPALSRLHMCTNCLEALNLNSEQFSSSLLELDVSNNRLSKIVADQSALAALGNLSYFNLSLNNVERLPYQLFSSLPNLRSVDLSYNSIGICPSEVAEKVGDSMSDCLVWSHLDSLRKLNLKGCQLRRVPPSAFTGMLLTHLDLSDNPGLLVEPGSIQDLSRTLQHLGLGNTGIRAFDFSSLTRLRSLNISRNSLTHIPSSLPNLELQTLDLRDNKLSTIPSGQANALARNLRTVFLSGNVFNCCQTEWYRTFELTKTVNMVDRSAISCQDLTRRTHQVDFFQSFLCGDMKGESIFWYILLLLSICLCFFCLLVIVLLKFRPKLLQTTIPKKCLKPTSY